MYRAEFLAESTFGISKRKVENNFSKLKAKSLLERVGHARGGHWKVK